MITLYLKREPQEDCTYGELTLPSGTVLQTLERPWKDNEAFVSCIPDGVYEVQPYNAPSHGDVYILSGGTVSHFPDNVAKRTGILIHPANTVQQLAGCIALGTERTKTGIAKSKKSQEIFQKEVQNNPAMLFISGVQHFE